MSRCARRRATAHAICCISVWPRGPDSRRLLPWPLAVLDGAQVIDAEELGVAPAVESLEVAEDVVLAVVDVDDHAGRQAGCSDEGPESNSQVHPERQRCLVRRGA